MENRALIALGLAAAGSGVAYWLWSRSQEDEGGIPEDGLEDETVTPDVPGMGLGTPQTNVPGPQAKAALIEKTIEAYQRAGKAALKFANTKAQKLKIVFAVGKAVKYLKDNKAQLVQRPMHELQNILRFQAGLLESHVN